MTRRLTGVEGPHAEATLVTGGAPAAAADVAGVLVHGRGGTPEGLLRLADGFYQPGATMLAPGAVRSSWFPGSYDATRDAIEPALTSAVDCVAATVGVAGKIGIEPHETILVGVSQGGTVVSELLRRHPQRYGAAFVVSAALPSVAVDGQLTADGRQTDAGSLDGTPVTLVSSDGDPHVSVSRVRATGERLRRLGAAVDVQIDDGDGHGLSDATMVEIAERIGSIVSA